jgi:hypothetical protein
MNNITNNVQLHESCKSLVKIVSGGQSGADTAALEAAVQLHLETGGFAPKGFRTDQGENIQLRDIYHLTETENTNYAKRTKLNVDHSDATLVIVNQLYPGGGSDKTIGYAQTKKYKRSEHPYSRNDNCYKPVLVIQLSDNHPNDEHIQLIRNFMCHNHVKTLNVAGNSLTTAGRTDFESIVRQLLVDALGGQR